MDADLQTRFQQLEAKVDSIWQSVEKTRRYFQVTLWVTVILFVGPLIIMAFALPAALNSYLGAISGASMEDLQGL